MSEMIDRKELASRLGVSPGYIPKLVKAKALPGPVMLGPRLQRWRWSDVEKFIAKKAGEEGSREGEETQRYTISWRK